ncbi:MAG: polyprenyl synthetase family protein [Armatimonadota bacterium]|nr:polyprenyl synthetase family protein [Armatimonadota bacterium]MDW8157132.1 polyprenyl synthetase family protein [Armatimonadota bacterium]
MTLVAADAALASAYAPVREDLDRLQHLLHQELAAHDPFLMELVSHVLQTRGKMVRPALAFLCARVAGGGGAHRDLLAAAVELIHVASLIHDDVIDEADRRRGHATPNARWGNHVAVLLGDYLFSKAFHLLSRTGRDDVASRVAFATVRMSQAELLQIKYGNTPHTDESIYFAIVEGKTAQLVSSACAGGALVGGAEGELVERLGAFGLHWGVAFQITDDTLDLTSDPEVLGKPIGSDVRGGKVTLPLIHALRTADEAGRRRLEAWIRSGDLEPLRQALEASGSLAYALEVARQHAHRALQLLDTLPPGPERDSLAALTEFVVSRRH